MVPQTENMGPIMNVSLSNAICLHLFAARGYKSIYSRIVWVSIPMIQHMKHSGHLCKFLDSGKFLSEDMCSAFVSSGKIHRPHQVCTREPWISRLEVNSETIKANKYFSVHVKYIK